MATIHLARDGAKIGSFSRAEVQEGLRTGKFLPTDLVWEEGMPSWRPLSEVMPQSAGSGPPALPDSAAAIPNHPADAGDGLPAFGGHGDFRSSERGHGDNESAAPAHGDGGNDTARTGLPWEKRKELGLIKAFVETVTMVLTQPTLAFAMMKKEGDMISPILFALIGGSIGVVVSQIYDLSLHALLPSTGKAFEFGSRRMLSIAAMVGAPVIVLCWIFIGGAILHLCLMLLGGAKRPFETTFRVVAFTLGSTYLLMLAPICGGIVASVWSIVAECIGLARAHETETGKAIAAVLLPGVVCCGAIILGGILLGGFGALNEFSRH